MFFEAGEAGVLGGDFAGGFFGGEPAAVDLKGEAAAGLGDAEFFVFEFQLGGFQIAPGALQRRAQVAVFHPQKGLAFGDVLAGDDVDGFDAAVNAGPEFGDGTADGGFAQDDVLETVVRPRNGDGDGGDGQQQHEADDSDAGDRGLGRGMGVGGGAHGEFVIKGLDCR